jgi:hypothetical protein
VSPHVWALGPDSSTPRDRPIRAGRRPACFYTCVDASDLPAPGHRYSFGVIKSAQTRGDVQVLTERSRLVVRVHLGADVAGG